MLLCWFSSQSASLLSPQCTFMIYDYTSLKTAKNIITVVEAVEEKTNAKQLQQNQWNLECEFSNHQKTLKHKCLEITKNVSFQFSFCQKMLTLGFELITFAIICSHLNPHFFQMSYILTKKIEVKSCSQKEKNCSKCSTANYAQFLHMKKDASSGE